MEFENEDVAKMVVEIMNAAILVEDFNCVVSCQQRKDMESFLKSRMLHFLSHHIRQ